MIVQYKSDTIDIQSGDIILFRTGFTWYDPLTWLSAAIRFFTKCYYNHCGICVINWGKPFINESNIKGVIARPLSKYIIRDKTKIIILRDKATLNEKYISTTANEMLGTKYDFSSLFFYQLYFRLTGKWIGRTKEAAVKDGMVCSEYVAWCYNLNSWWLYSAKELLNSNLFKVVYKEI